MNPTSRRWFLAPVSLLVLVLAAAACSSTPSPSVAATVNGSDITDVELKASIPLFEFLAELQGAVCGQTGATPPAPAGQEAACARQVLGSMIQESVLKDYATANDVTVSQAQVDEAIAQITQGGSPEQIEAGLKEAGLTLPQFEGIVRRLLLYSSVEQQQAAGNFDDADLRALYEERKIGLTTIHTKHILVETKEQAQKIKGKVTAENFDELAKEFSGDPGSADNGGDLGTTTADSFVPEFADAAVAAEPGEIVGPVRTDFGYHIIQLVSKETPSFEEARAVLVQGSEESAAAFQTWLQKQLDAANVTVNPRYGTWDAAQGTVVAITSTDPTATALPTPVDVPEQAPAEPPAEPPAG